MGKTSFLLSAGLFAAASSVQALNVRENMGNDRVVRLDTSHITESIRETLVDLEADVFGIEGDSVHIKVAPDAVDSLGNSGLEFHDTTEEWLSKFEKNFADPNFMCDDAEENCAERDMQSFYSSYQSFDAIISRVESLASQSSLARVITIGQSYEGRDIRLVEIGDQTKPMGFIFCNIHAREWLSPMYCAYMVETLLADGGHPILDSFSFGIVPSSNPDGYQYSRTSNSLWRKTRQPNSGSRCIGTDGNRNWDNNHCGVGSSTDPCSNTFCGRAPFDQPEVASLNDYVLAQEGRVMVVLDIHAYGSYYLYPYGYTEVLPPEPDFSKMRGCSVEAAETASTFSSTTWRAGRTPDLLGYLSGGTSKDYFYGNLGIIYAYTLELRGSEFQPPPSNIMPSNTEAFASIMTMMECAGRNESPTPPQTNPVPNPTPFPTVPPTDPPVPCFFGFC